jgi:hypothetical protein
MKLDKRHQGVEQLRNMPGPERDMWFLEGQLHTLRKLLEKALGLFCRALASSGGLRSAGRLAEVKEIYERQQRGVLICMSHFLNLSQKSLKKDR